MSFLAPIIGFTLVFASAAGAAAPVSAAPAAKAKDAAARVAAASAAAASAAAVTSAVGAPTTALSPKVFAQARKLIEAKDYLGFRVFLKKAYWKKITYGEWYAVRSLVNSEAGNVGFDLITIWNQRNPPGKSLVDKSLEEADALMLAGKFSEAFEQYQQAASALRRNLVQLRVGKGAKVYAQRIKDLSALYPYVLHSMGRALYSAGRFADALEVYGWISTDYARFRQILFEKMWAAFRAGRVERALGTIASQRSAYFSRYLSPEAYLIQTYIYRKLCRTDDLKEVIAEMKLYEASLLKGVEADWAGTDLETRVLWGLSVAGLDGEFPAWITREERENERKQIQAALHRAFGRQRPKLLNELRTTMAYAHLAGVADARTALKPIEKLTSRKALLELDLEIWPADSSEEWVDEVGTHYFVGDSLCITKNGS
ncbi:MAG: hypothetical protein NDJ90_11210 [Oligoflexia bacterium]|nr:hypothetical protein [Oligoflexia bacterium]